jgi:biotin carboxyl carrier protein
MNYFLLAETDFFRLINEAGDCNMETAYTAFATQEIEIKSQISGVLDKINVSIGDKVRIGD